MDILPRPNSKNTLAWTLGAGICLILCVLPFMHSDPLSENYTGALNRDPLMTTLCLLPVLGFMTMAFLNVAARHWPTNMILREVLIMTAMAVILMCIPYRKTEDFWSGLHVLFGFAAFVNLNRLCYQLFLFYPVSRAIWSGGMFLAFLLALYSASITGLSEIVFAAAILLSLTAACHKKNGPSV